MAQLTFVCFALARRPSASAPGRPLRPTDVRRKAAGPPPPPGRPRLTGCESCSSCYVVGLLLAVVGPLLPAAAAAVALRPVVAGLHAGGGGGDWWSTTECST